MIFKWYDIIGIPAFLFLIASYYSIDNIHLKALGIFVFVCTIGEIYFERYRNRILTRHIEITKILSEKIDIFEKAFKIK